MEVFYMRKHTTSYTYYKGDRYIAEGRADELAKKLDCKPKTIYRYSQPKYIANCKPSAPRAYRVED